MGYPMIPTEEDKIRYKNFLTSLQYVIPCSICANNYKRHLEIDLPLTDEHLKNKESLLRWTIDVHNIVNQENGKKTYTFDEAITVLTTFHNKEHFGENIENILDKDYKLKLKQAEANNDKTPITILSLLCVLGLLVIIAVIYKKK